jgi:hypothetical protein
MWMRGERPEPQALAARDAAAAGGDREAAAEAELLLADIHWYEGSRALAAEDLERATELAAALPAQTAATANVFEHAARFAMLAGEYDEAIRLGRSGLELARGLGLESIAAHCLSSLGVARACSGDRNGLADIRAALEIAARTNDGWAVWRARVNLADCLLWQTGTAEQAFAERHRLRPLLEAAGSWAIARWNESYDAWESYWLGRWPDALRLCDEFIEHVERGSPHNSASELYSLRALIRVARGEEGALDDARTAVALARRAQDARSLYPALAHAAEVAAALEQDAESDALVDELLAAGGPEPYPAYVTPLACAALLRGRPRDALARLAALGPSPWLDAATAMLGGDHADAADRFAAIGVLPEEAYARLLAAESLAAAGQGAVAQLQVERCTAFFERVGATRYLDRCARLSVVAAS